MHTTERYLVVSFLIIIFVLLLLAPKRLFSEVIRADSQIFIVIDDAVGEEGEGSGRKGGRVIPQAWERKKKTWGPSSSILKAPCNIYIEHCMEQLHGRLILTMTDNVPLYLILGSGLCHGRFPASPGFPYCHIRNEVIQTLRGLSCLWFPLMKARTTLSLWELDPSCSHFRPNSAVYLFWQGGEWTNLFTFPRSASYEAGTMGGNANTTLN